ncbi:MAG: hypothetical protein ACP5HM_10725 [Anaerolineae bacterium]
MSTGQKLLRAVGVTLVLTFLAVSAGWAALGRFTWQEGGPTVDLAEETGASGVYPGARKRGNAALAIGADGELAVLWAEEEGGLKLARRDPDSGAWSATGLASGLEVWYPDVAYAGSDLRVAWMQGDFDANPAPHGALMEQGVSEPTATTLMEDLYGYMGPHLAVGADGTQHLAFALATSAATWTQGKGDLYYARRTSAGSAWSVSTAVITGGLVLEDPSATGGIWFPNVAVSPDGSTVHLVWEQRILSLTEGYKFQVWYAEGTWSASEARLEIDESSLQRLSPAGRRAGRPAIAVDAQGRVHVTWTEITGNENKPGNEYVYYRRLDLPTSTLLTEEAVLVNVERPAWTTSVLASHEDFICVAWDSYPSSVGAGVGKEEINLRCSRDGGVRWQDFITVLSETEELSIFPHLLFDDQGQIHVLWEEHQGGVVTQNYRPFYRGGEVPRLRVFLPLVLRGG